MSKDKGKYAWGGFVGSGLGALAGGGLGALTGGWGAVPGAITGAEIGGKIGNYLPFKKGGKTQKNAMEMPRKVSKRTS